MEAIPPLNETSVNELAVIQKSHLKSLESSSVTLALLSLQQIHDMKADLIIRIYMAIAKYSLTDLASRAGVDRGHLGRIVNGEHSPKKELIAALAKVFGPSFTEAIHLSDKNKAPQKNVRSLKKNTGEK
jgi:plasmid maintenance system antidote protein VapI